MFNKFSWAWCGRPTTIPMKPGNDEGDDDVRGDYEVPEQTIYAG
jgi:hypothetical protein